MPKYTLLGAAALVFAIGIGASSVAYAGDCGGGELTLDRLAQSDCTSRIPVPVLRSVLGDRIAVGQSQPAEAAAKKWDFIETAGRTPGETRMVRLVGSRFLPDRSEKIDFYGQPSDPISAAFHHAVAYLANAEGVAGSAIPRQALPSAPAVTQEAMADIGLTALRN